jgi:cytokinesis protein
MDNLLDKLRAGDLDTSVKRNRNERSVQNSSRQKRIQRSESVALLAEDLLKSIQTEEGTPTLPRSNRMTRKNNGSKALLDDA